MKPFSTNKTVISSKSRALGTMNNQQERKRPRHHHGHKRKLVVTSSISGGHSLPPRLGTGGNNPLEDGDAPSRPEVVVHVASRHHMQSNQRTHRPTMAILMHLSNYLS